MIASKNDRLLFDSSSDALIPVPYSLKCGENPSTLSQDTTAYATADPPYLASQVYT